MNELYIKIKGKNLKRYPKIRGLWYRDDKLFFQVDINKSGSVKCKNVPFSNIEYFEIYPVKDKRNSATKIDLVD